MRVKLVLTVFIVLVLINFSSCNIQNTMPVLENNGTLSTSEVDNYSSEIIEPTDGSILHNVDVTFGLIGSSFENAETFAEEEGGTYLHQSIFIDITNKLNIGSEGSLFYGLVITRSDKIYELAANDNSGDYALFVFRNNILIAYVRENDNGWHYYSSYEELLQKYFIDNGVVDVPLPQLKTMDEIGVDFLDGKIRESRAWQANNCLMGLICSKAAITSSPEIVYAFYAISNNLS